MKKLTLGTLVLAGLFQMTSISSAQAADSCEASSGYCLSIGGMTSQDGAILYALYLTTPLSKTTFMSTPNDVAITVPRNGNQVTLKQGNIQIAVGTLEGKNPGDSSGMFGLKLNDGVAMSSSVTNKGTRISCSVNALGFIVKYSTPVVQVTTAVQSAAGNAQVNSVVEVGSQSESALGGLFCKNGTYEVHWDN